jgi:myo-inositol-1(or 4)-monophosphatase
MNDRQPPLSRDAAAPLAAEAVDIARRAGKLLRKLFDEPRSVDYKGRIDLVTDADRASEELVLELLAQRFADHEVLAEETAGGRVPRPDPCPPYLWVIDPLDGTTNYAHGLPVFCVSVGLLVEGRPAVGAVYDPLRDEMFHGGRGLGAFLNEEPIRVSRQVELRRALLATGFPYDLATSSNNNLDNFTRFSYCTQALRRMGSAALDLCYVACGRFDGFWELKLYPWDTTAAASFITEAGGVISDFSGRGYDPFGLEVLACNGLIFDQMTAVIREESPSGEDA